MSEHKRQHDIPRGQSGLYKNGQPYEPTAFDLDVLRLMPDVGATKGRYMPDYLTVQQIKRQLDPALTSGFVSVRLRTMKDELLIVRFGSKKAGGGWQRTAKGKELAAEEAATK